MRRSILAILGAAVAAAGLGPAASGAGAAVLCVGHRPHCHPTIQAALDASHDGDEIRVRPGRFAGGLTIARSVKLVGAGRGDTVIDGGGPVVTIGVLDAPSEPTVTIEGVTITGGVTSASGRCGPTCGTNYEQATALGGGIAIPPAADGASGATVTIVDSVIAGNRVAPSHDGAQRALDLPGRPVSLRGRGRRRHRQLGRADAPPHQGQRQRGRRDR